MGLVRMVRPWNEWLIVWGYDINGPAPEVDEARATEIAHKLIGDRRRPRRDRLDVAVDEQQAVRRALLGGPRVLHGRRGAPPPAVERPRLEHLGRRRVQPRAGSSRSSCADRPTPSLLRTLRRRAGAGRRADRQAREQEHRGVRADLRGARPARHRAIPARWSANMAARMEDTPAAAEQRAKLRRAIELKNYEFNAHGVELGQRYRSAAVVSDGTPEPRVRARSRAVLPRDHLAGRAPAALLARARRAAGQHARSGRQGTLLPAHRASAASRGREAAETATGRTGVEIAVYVDRAGTRRARHLRRLGTALRGRRERLRPRASRRPRRAGAARRSRPIPPSRWGKPWSRSSVVYR